MAGIDLVTGYQGVNHVTAAQWADFNRGIFGDAALLDIGSKMNVEIQTANQITMSDGVVVYDGREFYIGYGESVNIPIASGTQGMKRNDIVVIQYDRNEETGVESGTVQVVEGTPSENNPQDPAYSDQDIRTGVFMSQKPFCRVRINGTAIEGIDYLVEVKGFKPLAFSSPVNSLDGTDPELPLAAPQGKALNEKIQGIIGGLGESGRVEFVTRMYTTGECIVDNEAIQGNCTIIYMRVYYQTNRSFLIGAMIGVDVQEIWTKYVANTKILLQKQIDSNYYGWTSIG